jgi:hypothetical protein
MKLDEEKLDPNKKAEPEDPEKSHWNPNFSEKEYTQKEFFFTKNELLRMTVNSILLEKVSLEQTVLKSAEASLFNNEILPRNGYKPNPDYGIDFWLEHGKFILYIPKYQCSVCHRKAKYQKEKLLYCEAHFPQKPTAPSDEQDTVPPVKPTVATVGPPVPPVVEPGTDKEDPPVSN